MECTLALTAPPPWPYMDTHILTRPRPPLSPEGAGPGDNSAAVTVAPSPARAKNGAGYQATVTIACSTNTDIILCMQLLKEEPKIKSVGDPELGICNLLSHCSSSNKITSAHSSSCCFTSSPGQNWCRQTLVELQHSAHAYEWWKLKIIAPCTACTVARGIYRGDFIWT